MPVGKGSLNRAAKSIETKTDVKDIAKEEASKAATDSKIEVAEKKAATVKKPVAKKSTEKKTVAKKTVAKKPATKVTDTKKKVEEKVVAAEGVISAPSSQVMSGIGMKCDLPIYLL